MKQSTARCGAFVILVLLPLLPVGGIVLHKEPETVFFLGAASFILDVVLLLWLLIAGSLSPEGSPSVARPLRFTIRDLVCLTMVVFGMTMFLVARFRCEASQRASLPGALPAAVYRQFAWELEAGLVCMTIGGLLWVRPASGLREVGT